MKVYYLHGLESEAGGPKVDFLNEVTEQVFAPAMDYTNHRLFGELYRKILKEGKPDLIIGSSMGGYFADALGSHFDIEVLLFNPALHSRTIEINLPYGEQLSLYLKEMAYGSLGKSLFKGKSVRELIAIHFPPTLELAFLSIFFSIFFFVSQARTAFPLKFM